MCRNYCNIQPYVQLIIPSFSWQNYLVWAVVTPTFERVVFPRPFNQLHVVLMRGPFTPSQIRTSCLWTMIDRTWSLESRSLCGCMRKHTSVVFVTLGFVTFGVLQSQIVARREGGGTHQVLFSLRLGL